MYAYSAGVEDLCTAVGISHTHGRLHCPSYLYQFLHLSSWRQRYLIGPKSAISILILILRQILFLASLLKLFLPFLLKPFLILLGVVSYLSVIERVLSIYNAVQCTKYVLCFMINTHVKRTFNNWTYFQPHSYWTKCFQQ